MLKIFTDDGSCERISSDGSRMLHDVGSVISFAPR